MSCATKTGRFNLLTTFRRQGFCDFIREVLAETGLAPQYLELELTESLLLANADVMLSVVQELKAIVS